ncbi:MAG: hypothetical protein ACFFG0_53825 [Candidatus Thorarchaeota archaeon]
MNPENFLEKLNSIQELMTQEKYSDAIEILENLKNIEKNSGINYNYNLIHQLYQLDSNCRSALNQQIILKQLKDISTKKNSISFEELNQVLREKGGLQISKEILRREIELLILRNFLKCELKGDQFILFSPERNH